MMRKLCVIVMFCILFFSIFAVFVPRGICPGATVHNQNKLTIIAPSKIYEASLFVITVKSNETLIENATISINLSKINEGGYNETTNSSGQAVFLGVYVPLVNMTFEITAYKEGYAPAIANITVINIPQLVIMPITDRAIAGETFTIKVVDVEVASAGIDPTILANKSYQGISNVTVTIDTKNYTKNYTTDENGYVNLIIPNVKGENIYTIFATKLGYIDSVRVTMAVYHRPPPIPGFELVFAIIGIALALFIIRKKMK